MNTRCCYYCAHRQKEIQPERSLHCNLQNGKLIERDGMCFAWRWRFPNITEEEFKKENGVNDA